MEQTVDTLSIRQDKVEKDVCELFEKVNNHSISQATVNEKLNSILVTMGELKAGLADLKEVPSRRWENLIGYIASAVIAALAMYIFTK